MALVLGLTGAAGVAVSGARIAGCGGPLVITKGGTYSGCWSGNGTGGPAVRVLTADPVTLERCEVKGRSLLVQATFPHTKLTVADCRLSGVAPEREGAHADYAILADRFDYLHVEHNLFEGKGGVKAIGWSGVPSPNPVLIRFNRARNVDGRLSDGRGGWQVAGHAPTGVLTFAQLAEVRGAPGVEIAWNEVLNEPYASAVEDNISLFASSGTQASPIDVHDNYIEGGYPPDPATDAGYSGGGIMLGDNGGEWLVARDNQVVATSNYGVGIAGGDHNRAYRNRVVASGTLPDGRTVASQNVGVYVWSVTGAPTSDNAAHDNEVAWQDGPVRNDWWLPNCTGRCDNLHLDGEAPVTRAHEEAERARWLDKLATAGIRPGPRAERLAARPG